ncbi:hypothetical protein [Actinoplanes sp. NPDC051494]|uniref:hypothetical protein n=1 Tax=Actinoplanes sp. NPDC051494 TaxID=3363907 RepID=UPI0037A7661A
MSHRSEPRPAVAGDVLIQFGGERWLVPRGAEVTIGRSRASMVRLPDDDHLSRRAGLLRVLDDCVLVRNESQHKPLVVRPPAGEDRVVEPGAATTSLPFRRFAVVLAGSGGATVRIDVDAARVTPGAAGDPETRAPQTVTDPVSLSGTQHRVLVALCAPLLTESGPRAAPATYAQIGHRLTLRPQYVRNVVKSLREELAGYGIGGLTRDDRAATHDDFRWALARWAVRSGWVTPDDVRADHDA